MLKKQYVSMRILPIIVAFTLAFGFITTVQRFDSYADEMPKTTLIHVGAKQDVQWTLMNESEEYENYTLGNGVDRLIGGYGPYWAILKDDFKKCGVVTKITLSKEDGTVLDCIEAADKDKGLQFSDFVETDGSFEQNKHFYVLSEDKRPSSDSEHDSYDIRGLPGAGENGADGNDGGQYLGSDYFAIEGPFQNVSDNYNQIITIFFEGAEDTPVIPPEVQAVIDAIKAIGDITESNYLEKEAAITAAKDLYDALESQDYKDQVTNYDTLTAAEASIDSFKLAAAKTKAKGELDTLLAGKNEADYDADDWTALTKAISDGKDAIDVATTTDGVNEAKSAAENTVAAIKTKKQKAAEKAEAIKKQKAAAKKYKVAGFKIVSKNRKFTVSWKKTKSATGYQVQYKLKSAKKYKTLKNTTALKVTSKKLKLNKKYQFRVRTYTKVDGTKIYGVWTKIKTVKCRGRK